MDLHLHTPASADYQEADIGYLDILRKAEFRGLDIIAFTDHNTLAGYSAMWTEIDRLAYLEQLGRSQPEEQRRLAEYRRLLAEIYRRLLPALYRAPAEQTAAGENRARIAQHGLRPLLELVTEADGDPERGLI